ncbi:MAG: hypothetical protein ABUL60_17185 [Myxococcales bacterium]
MVHRLTGRKAILLVTLLLSCGGRAQGTASGTESGGADNLPAGGSGTSSGTSNLGGGSDAGGDVPNNLQCSVAKPCGGTLEGDWSVIDSCLQVGGVADVLNWGLGCKSVPVLGTLAVTGSFSVSSAGALVDATRTTGDVDFDFASSCLIVSGVPISCEALDGLVVAFGYQSATCSEVGQSCRCRASVDQLGSMGLVSVAPVTAGTVSLASPSTFTVADGPAFGQVAEYSFCAKSKRLTVTPNGSSWDLVGTIQLGPR